ncbi:hypothetical protein F5Y04DRAFT_106590 [Hypomontagnella monticulosa]|nr:hypothetical protein F5Y04DRAFT_106590 [Hypomontagnella monticulosa]
MLSFRTRQTMAEEQILIPIPPSLRSLVLLLDRLSAYNLFSSRLPALFVLDSHLLRSCTHCRSPRCPQSQLFLDIPLPAEIAPLEIGLLPLLILYYYESGNGKHGYLEEFWRFLIDRLVGEIRGSFSSLFPLSLFHLTPGGAMQCKSLSRKVRDHCWVNNTSFNLRMTRRTPEALILFHTFLQGVFHMIHCPNIGSTGQRLGWLAGWLARMWFSQGRWSRSRMPGGSLSQVCRVRKATYDIGLIPPAFPMNVLK